MKDVLVGAMTYRNGVPYYNAACGSCITGESVNQECAACRASQDPELMKRAWKRSEDD